VATILCVENDPAVCGTLDRLLREMGHEPIFAGSAREGIEILTRLAIDLLIVARTLPDRDGFEILDQMRGDRLRLPSIVLSDFRAPGQVEEAESHGASDILTKPLRSEGVRLSVKNALEVHLLRRRNDETRHEISSLRVPSVIGVGSEALRDLLEALDLVAPTGADVLLHGEAGTGKKLFAREIHRMSPRRDQPFVTVCCAADSELELAREIFGREPLGDSAHETIVTGALERAARGTLLLDEIPALSGPLQGKLLQALRQRPARHPGGSHPGRIDVRVIATAHRDLSAEVEAGRIQPELQTELSAVSIRVPPLRERLQDIPRLVEGFVAWNVGKLGVKTPEIPPETFEYLRRRPWPGNIRELANAVERAMILSSGSPLAPDFFERSPREVRRSAGARALQEPTAAEAGEVLDIRELERVAIHRALKKTGGHKAKAAALLGINERTLRNKLKAEALPVWVSPSDETDHPLAGDEWSPPEGI